MAEPVAVDRIRSFADRYDRLLDDLESTQADIKEVLLEAKTAGLNVPELKKWVVAQRRDKVAKRVADVVDAALYGEALGHDVGMTPDSEDRARERSSESLQGEARH